MAGPFAGERRIGRGVTVFDKRAAQENYRGSFGEISLSLDECILVYHDGCCCGGKVISSPGMTDAEIEAIVKACLTTTNPVVSVTQDANGDYIVTYLDGTTALLDDIDVPVITTVVNPNGTTTLIIDGNTIGTFLPGSTSVDNGDGTTTITLSDGTVVTVDNDGDNDTISPPFVDNGNGTTTITDTAGNTIIIDNDGVDNNTTYTFVTNVDGSITATGSDGSTYTSAPNEREIGPDVVADPCDDTTWPAAPPAPFRFQRLVDANGDIFGSVTTANGPLRYAKHDTFDVVADGTGGAWTLPHATYQTPPLKVVQGNSVGQFAGGTYTAPKDGLYMFTFSVHTPGLDNDFVEFLASIFTPVNFNFGSRVYQDTPGNFRAQGATASQLVRLAAGQTVTPYAYGLDEASTSLVGISNIVNHFSAARVAE